jgi:hypothetical protein
MNAVVRALPRTACLSGLFGPTKRTPLRAAPFERITARSNDPRALACSAVGDEVDLNGERAQVSIARPCDRGAGGRKEPA